MSDTAARTLEPARDRIGAEEVLAALASVSRGRVYDLGTELSADMPHGPRDTFAAFRLTPYRTPRCLCDPGYAGHDFSMELIMGAPHLGSHIDGFAHIQENGRIFGNVAAIDAFDDFGWKQHGMETVPPIVTRGVLIDVPRSLGLEKLPDDFEIEPAHIDQCLDAQGIEVRVGDVVLVRTGKMLDYHNNPTSYFVAHAGVGVEAALALYEKGMAVLGTDTTATEPFPLRDEQHTTHRAMLVQRGVHLLEILDLEELSADRVYTFLFVCLPLKIVGATGSWVRPIAVA